MAGECGCWSGSSGCDYRGWQVSVVAGLVLVGVITEGGW